MPDIKKSLLVLPHLKKFKATLLTAFIFYVTICSIVVYSYQFRAQGIGIFDIGFGFGPLVKSIVEGGVYRVCDQQYFQCVGQHLCFSGHRMPFVPFLLAALVLVYNNVLFVSIAKNLILSSFIWISISGMLQNYKDKKHLVAVASIFIFSFPIFILQNFTLYAEEGYLIPMVCLLFNFLLLNRGMIDRKIFILLPFVNAMLFLTKTSMVPLCLLFCIFYYIITRNRKVLVAFTCSLSIALLSWGLFNLYNTGRFTISSSYSGFTLYAGNNELSLSVYKDANAESLDMLEQKIYCPVRMADEWAYNKYYTDKAIEFIINNPKIALELFMRRFYIFFFRITNRINSPENLPFAKIIEFIGAFYMLLFRVVLWASLMHALFTIYRGGIKGIFYRNEKSIGAFLYLSFILFYSLPYLIASVYMRHVIPILIPTVQYAVWAMNKKLEKARI